MLKKILRTLERIADALWQIQVQLSAIEEHQRAALEQKPEEPVQVEGKDPDAWMHAGIASILGYRPNGKKGEE